MSESQVHYANQGSAEMQAAYASARETFKYFWREMTWEYRRIVPGLEMAAVKASFNDPGNHPDDAEHMWLSDAVFDGESIAAVLLNQPNHLTSVKLGDPVTITLPELEDWMYGMHGRMYGGFTIQAMRTQMGPEERRAHDDAWGFDFGDPNHVELVPNWEALQPAKLGFFGKLFGKQPPPSPPAGDPSAEHPMSVNMAEKLGESVDSDPTAFLTSADDDGLTLLHSLALGGSADGVRVLLDRGADPRLQTKRGFTALELAERLGWSRCVELLRAAS